jgi:hypothetical protein
MPDQRRHRGPHPEDAQLFAAARLPSLQAAAVDYALLLDRGYPPNASLALVGNRFELVERQRRALLRAVCSETAAAARAARRLAPAGLRDATLWVDGFNVLTTVEVAIAHGLVLRGRDGCYRDLASMHGTWRRVDETDLALRRIGDWLTAAGVASIRWLLDRPVSNAGRLAERLRALAAEHGWTWDVALVASPDRELVGRHEPVATADGPVLDRCGPWLDLARRVVDDGVPGAWIVALDVGPLPGS